MESVATVSEHAADIGYPVEKIEEILDKLAADIQESVKGKDVEIADKVGAMRALTAYYLARKKHATPDQDEDAGDSFADFTNQMVEHTN